MLLATFEALLMWEYQSSKNAWMTGRLYREWLVSYETTMASVNISVCCPQLRVPYFETCAPLVPPSKYHQQRLNQGIIYCRKRAYQMCLAFVVARNRQGCSHRISKKVEHLGFHARYRHGLGIHHACSNSKLLCKMWLRHYIFSQYQLWRIKLWMGWTTRPYWLAQDFRIISERLQVFQNWSVDKFGRPWSSLLVRGRIRKEDGKKKTRTLPTRLSQKGAQMQLWYMLEWWC
jgi:hypothetical protein